MAIRVTDTRNTHSKTMTLAFTRIRTATLTELEEIASELEKKAPLLNAGDAKFLLKKVRKQIAEKHFA